MFIERARSKIPPRSSGAKRTCLTLPETSRSAGARVVLTAGFYKHLAPLEPETTWLRPKPCYVISVNSASLG